MYITHPLLITNWLPVENLALIQIYHLQLHHQQVHQQFHQQFLLQHIFFNIFCGHFTNNINNVSMVAVQLPQCKFVFVQVHSTNNFHNRDVRIWLCVIRTAGVGWWSTRQSQGNRSDLLMHVCLSGWLSDDIGCQSSHVIHRQFNAVWCCCAGLGAIRFQTGGMCRGPLGP